MRPVARLAGNPDDVTVAPDGSMWVSDVQANAVLHLSATGAVLSRISDRNQPEGTVILADGRLVIADQRDNTMIVVTPSGGAATVVLATLPTAPGQLGIDGIGYSATDGRLLAPDSPVGKLFSVSPENGARTLLSNGLGRVVDAAVGPDGAIYAAAETAHGLLRVPAAGGTATTVGTLTDLDDVVALNGLLYVTDLGGAVWAVDPTNGADRRLVTAAHAPQGLAVASSHLVLVDETTGEVMSLQPCA